LGRDYTPLRRRNLLRIIDANFNRAAEGLRVLEEIARLLLDDAELTEWLKSVRHELLRASSPFQQELLSAREAANDVGVSAEAIGEGARANLCSIVTANARRVQESLRVLEEFAKLPSSPLSAEAAGLEQTRFAIYDLERQLVDRLLRRDKASRLAGLYVIIDPQLLGDRDEAEVARQVVQGGAAVIQLRDKRGPCEVTLKLAQEIGGICAEKGVLFIVNDHLDVALAAHADGLHVGQGDLPIAQARRLLPIGTLLGCSTSMVAEAIQAQSEGADYVAVGSMYPTASKEQFTLVGPERVREVKAEVSVPLVAIGGINEANVGEVVEAGADAVAVISAILQTGDVEGATRSMVAGIGEAGVAERDVKEKG
jgi:thiamine-phosphate pyrophosphorylase